VFLTIAIKSDNSSRKSLGLLFNRTTRNSWPGDVFRTPIPPTTHAKKMPNIDIEAAFAHRVRNTGGAPLLDDGNPLARLGLCMVHPRGASRL
jgi:hypothetical protein